MRVALDERIKRQPLERGDNFQKAQLAAVGLAAEIGRQPWIVWGYLRTSDGLSAVVKAHQVLASLIGFGLIYLLLFVLFIFLLNRKIQHGPEPLEESGSLPENWLNKARA